MIFAFTLWLFYLIFLEHSPTVVSMYTHVQCLFVFILYIAICAFAFHLIIPIYSFTILSFRFWFSSSAQNSKDFFNECLKTIHQILLVKIAKTPKKGQTITTPQSNWVVQKLEWACLELFTACFLVVSGNLSDFFPLPLASIFIYAPSSTLIMPLECLIDLYADFPCH